MRNGRQSEKPCAAVFTPPSIGGLNNPSHFSPEPIVQIAQHAFVENQGGRARLGWLKGAKAKVVLRLRRIGLVRINDLNRPMVRRPRHYLQFAKLHLTLPWYA